MNSTFDQVLVGTEIETLEESELSLLETLDHVLNRGLVIAGEITISVADVVLDLDPCQLFFWLQRTETGASDWIGYCVRR